MHKHPVSIALSNRVLEKIDKEASKQKRSRSEYIELQFETLLIAQQELENYVKNILGNDFSVDALTGSSTTSVWVKIVKGTVNESFMKRLDKVFGVFE